MNRLKSATEAYDTTQTWKQTFVFDRYGNRRFDFTGGNTTFPASNCTEAICNPTISTSNNRLTSTGYTFDNAGNTTADAQGRTFVYDGENKQISVSDTSGTIGVYSYDGDGKRVKKISANETVVFVYNAIGQLVAEYADAISSTPKVNYLTADHLGSPRINTDQNAAVTARHDYHPFGEEIYTSQRTSGLGYAADTIRKQFTGYEKDNETDLDFAQARIFANKHGRFTSTDPSRKSIQTANPQTWNRYSYCFNNPLALIDDNGKWPTSVHNRIIDLALPGLSKAERKTMKNASLAVDMEKGSMTDPKLLHKHGLRAPDESVDEAARKTSSWIETQMGEARSNQNRAGSLASFGAAFHAVSDMTSPDHEGYQVWRSIASVRGAVSGVIHAAHESLGFNFHRHGLAIGATRRLYADTYGQAALNAASGGIVYGGNNDPVIREIASRAIMTGASPAEQGQVEYLYRLGLTQGWNLNRNDTRKKRTRDHPQMRDNCCDE